MGVTWLCGRRKTSPRHITLNTVHVEGTVMYSNNFVAEEGQERAETVTVHRDGELACVGILVSTNFHVTILNHDIAAVESAVVRWVVVIGSKD